MKSVVFVQVIKVVLSGHEANLQKLLFIAVQKFKTKLVITNQ